MSKSTSPFHQNLATRQNHAIQQHQPDAIQERRPTRYCSTTATAATRHSKPMQFNMARQPIRATKLNTQPERLSSINQEDSAQQSTSETKPNNQTLSSTTIQ